MNANLRRTLIALAISSVFAGPMAYAKHHTPPPSGTSVATNQQSTSHDKVINKSGVQNTSTIGKDAGESASGNLGVNVASGDNNQQSNVAAIASEAATSDTSDVAFLGSDQSNHHNFTFNGKTQNSATISSGDFDTDSGNVGVNVASGDGNQQSNAMSMASSSSDSTDLSFAFADARQSVKDDRTINIGNTNKASIGDAFYGDSGNIGANVAAGDNNQQLNALSASVAPGTAYAMAAANVNQRSRDNTTVNDPAYSWCDTIATTNTASIAASALSGDTGNIGIDVASGTGNMQANVMALGAANSNGKP
jgi:trimeric autotransporter adhesin